MKELLLGLFCCMAGGVITVTMLVVAGLVRNAKGMRHDD